MTYDLRHEAWLPWRRASGTIEWALPATIVDGIGVDPIVALATPRPDFDGAVQEFLIGILTAAFAPADESMWLALWKNPPSVERLQAALDALPPAFDLEGEGPRFFQDLSAADFVDTEPGPIEQLLIESPGDQTVKLNKDLFVKRDRAVQFGRPAAAMALLTLQTYAPSGGQGHRTSLRGGGPLTTLAEPRVDRAGRSTAHLEPLWYKLWANVETQAAWSARTPARSTSTDTRFPWMSPTRTSEKGKAPTTPEEVHPLQVYFGLPRRIRLEFGDGGRCDLTGRDDSVTVTGFRMRNYGVQYQGFEHPLSPHYRTKPGEDLLPVHGKQGGVGWRDWLGIALRVADGGLRQPAAAVATFSRRADRVRVTNPRLHVFGYDMDNMKARGWTEALFPTFAVDDERQMVLLHTAASLTNAAGIASTALLGAVKSALFQDDESVRGDLTQVRNDLWAATESDFFETMSAIAALDLDQEGVEALADARRAAFATMLEARAPEVFDRWCPTAGLAPTALKRHVTSRYNLVTTLRGFSKLGEKLFDALAIPLPGGGQAARRKTRSRKEAAT